jgi:hypothetical protein
MTYSDLKRKYGTDAGIAAALNTSRQLVAHWRKKGISPARQAWIQVKTRGRFRAEQPQQEG